MFEENDGVARLEALEYHGNDTVQSQANDLLETYFYQETEQQVKHLSYFKPFRPENKVHNLGRVHFLHPHIDLLGLL